LLILSRPFREASRCLRPCHVNAKVWHQTKLNMVFHWRTNHLSRRLADSPPRVSLICFSAARAQHGCSRSAVQSR
jgi:hypothetical protein